MDSILADEPSVQTLPDDDAGEATSVASDEVEANTEPVAKPAEAKAKEAPKPTVKAGEADDSEDEPVPDNLDGLKKALAASRGDKRKARKQWQEAREQLARLEGEIGLLRKQGQSKAEAPQSAEPKQEKRTFWDDPEAYVKELVPDVEAVAARTRADVSEIYARKAHADYEEKKAYFAERASRDPSMWREIFATPNPAETLYERATALKEREEFDRDPNAWREAERARLREELTAEAQPESRVEQVVTPTARPPIPKSNAGARGVGASAKQAWSGPRSLEDILA
jgi:hypothetical protein